MRISNVSITTLSEVNISISFNKKGSRCQYKKTLVFQFKRSHWKCSVKKDVLKDFANFTGTCVGACNFIKMRLQHKCFPMQFTKFLRAPGNDWLSFLALKVFITHFQSSFLYFFNNQAKNTVKISFLAWLQSTFYLILSFSYLISLQIV